MKRLALACLVWFTVAEAGDFDSTGRHVEFADRFGWRSYSLRFDFDLIEGRVEKGRLLLEVVKRDGSVWKHACKAAWARASVVPGLGTSVAADCRIEPKKFAKAVGLDARDVGLPALFTQAMIVDGKARPGAQRGLYFLPDGGISDASLSSYTGGAQAPAVVFRSN